MSEKLAAALDYLERRGWAPVDLPVRSKNPGRNGWQDERWTADQLTERLDGKERNVGVLLGEPSGGLVDVDLDCSEAIRLAEAFLPATGAVFGRKSTPTSHQLYVAKGAKTVRFEDPTVPNGDRAVLLELRSTGAQTVFPLSTHPSGEAITWARDGDPAEVEVEMLVRQVRALAAASLLARYWHNGARHGAAGALAGGLLRAGYPAEQVESFIGAIADAAGDEEVSDRLRMVTDTAAKLNAGKRVTGWPRLAEHLGDPVVDRVRDWLGATGGDDDWEQPLPLGQQLDLPRFPVGALPHWLATYVVALATSTQTPPDLPGMLVLAALSTAVGGRVEVEVRPDWWEPSNLFVVVAQEPGTRKSAVFRDVTAPLEELEQELVEVARPEVERAHYAKEVAHEQAAARKRDVGKGKATAEQAIEAAVEAALLEVPAIPRMVADDVTPEALTSLLAEQGGRMAVLSSEGGIFTMLRGRYSPSSIPDLDIYLKGHAGDRKRVDRKGRAAEFIERPALTVGLAVQPAVLSSLAGRPEFRGYGLLARFLYVLPDPNVGRRNTRPDRIPPEVRERYRANLRQLAERLRGKAVTLTLDPAALVLLEDQMAELEPRLAPEDGDLGHVADWAAKLAGATVRIAALLHLAEHHEAPEATVIGPETMAAAWRMADYLVPHAVAAFAEMGANPALAAARYTLERIRVNGWSTFTRRDLYRATGRGRFPTVGDLDPALAVLVDHCYIRLVGSPSPGPKGGRKPSPTYEVNPLGAG
jgi:replicative DNA helicase